MRPEQPADAPEVVAPLLFVSGAVGFVGWGEGACDGSSVVEIFNHREIQVDGGQRTVDRAVHCALCTVHRSPSLTSRTMITTDATALQTGFPLVKLNMDGTRAVTALVAFDAGARTERPEENGMAHFLEHLVFKGGEKYSSYRDVNETAERLGAQLNAYTSHDIVAFH